VQRKKKILMKWEREKLERNKRFNEIMARIAALQRRGTTGQT